VCVCVCKLGVCMMCVCVCQWFLEQRVYPLYKARQIHTLGVCIKNLHTSTQVARGGGGGGGGGGVWV